MRITIEGSGKTFNFQLEIIKRALEKEGLTVHVENKELYDNDFVLEHGRKLIAEGHKFSAHIRTIQHKWGG